MTYGLTQVSYLLASALFIFALHWMNAPATARKGVYAGVAATAIAVLATWAQPSVVHHGWIVLAIAAGFKSFTFEKTRDRNVKWKNRKHRVPLQEGRLWVEG